jgi:hypothetical protein
MRVSDGYGGARLLPSETAAWGSSRRASYGDLTSDLNGVGASAIQSLVPSLTVETTLTPPIPIALDPTLTPGNPSPLLSLLRPTVILNTPAGPVTVAPYGQALGISSDVNTWGMLAGVGLAAFAGFFVWLGTRLVKR